MKTSSSLQITRGFADSVHVCETLFVIRVKCERRNRIFNHTAQPEPKEVGDEDVQLAQSQWKHVDPSNCTRNHKLPTSTEHNCLKVKLNNSSSVS